MGLRQRITILILLAVAGAALVTASLYLGLPASGRVARIVFLEIRLPRLLVGAAAGAGLGVAGLLVQRAMGALRRGRTSFVIAHRLSTIRDADTILVMERGDIVEQGSHAELLERGGTYARLHAAQFARALAENESAPD